MIACRPVSGTRPAGDDDDRATDRGRGDGADLAPLNRMGSMRGLTTWAEDNLPA